MGRIIFGIGFFLASLFGRPVETPYEGVSSVQYVTVARTAKKRKKRTKPIITTYGFRKIPVKPNPYARKRAIGAAQNNFDDAVATVFIPRNLTYDGDPEKIQDRINAIDGTLKKSGHKIIIRNGKLRFLSHVTGKWVKKNLYPVSNAYDDIFRKAKIEYNLPKDLLKALCHAESGLINNSRSPKDARGLCQLVGKLSDQDAYNPYKNIMRAGQYLRAMLDKFHNDEEMAVAAYNAGPDPVENNRPDKSLPYPLYKETERHNVRTFTYWWLLKNGYNRE